jgi:lactam utilization protein B
MIAVVLVLTASSLSTLAAQEKRVSQTSGVDNSKMGPYRALAQLALAASQRGDIATAAELARILERTWDKAEDYGGDTALSKTNHALFEQIDKAMDQFINLLTEHATSAPDGAKVKTAYNVYMEKLKLAD